MAKSKKSSIAVVNEILRDMKAKKLANLYCFDGEEEFYINRLEETFENLLTEGERDFGLHIFYGKDADWKNVLNVCQQAAMFGGMQLVMIKEAAEFKNLKELEPYLSKLPASTHLFIAHKHKKIDGRGSLLKTMSKLGVYARFDKLREEKVPAWIESYCKEQKINISIQNANLLAINLGSDLQKIANELDKVQLNLKEGEEVTAELIEKYVGISKDYNLFEYTNAILYKNKAKAYNILNYVVANPKTINSTPVIANLFNTFNAVYAYHKLGRPDPSILQQQMNINYYVAMNCTKVAQFYNIHSSKQAIKILHEMALKERGVGGSVSDASVHKELMGKLLAL
jgi:DNA polymerase III subunit delta